MVTSKLNAFYHCAGCKKVRSLLDFLWGTCSIILVPALVVICAFWLLEPQLINRISSKAQISAYPGEVTKIPSSITTNADIKTEYTVKLVDGKGVIQYVYPKRYSDSTNINDLVLRMPQGIEPGTYTIVATMKYKLNPLKVGTMKIELAHVTIAYMGKVN